MIYMKAKNFDLQGNFNFSGHLFENHWSSNPAFDKEIVIGAKTCSVQADEHELARCWKILGNNTPPNISVYTFVGDQAKTIILNW